MSVLIASYSMVMADKHEICEMLCYLQNNYSKATRAGLLTTLSGFYSSDEISEAKNKLFALYEAMCSDGTVDGATKHRNVKHKLGEEKRRRLDVEDMLALYADLDKVKVQLPVFLAANLSRIPPFAPDTTDFCMLAYNVNQLQCQFAKLEEHVSNIARVKGSTGGNSGAVVTGQAAFSSLAHDLPVVTADVHLDTTQGTLVPQPQDNTSWAATAAQDRDQWTQVPVRVSKQPRRPVKVTGKKTADVASVKGVPRKPILAAYVGRLHNDTSEEVLTNYLTDEGMRGVVCKKVNCQKW